MQRFLLGSIQALGRKILVLSLLTLITLSGVFIFVEQPSYAITTAKDKISSDEKVDRAYQLRVGTGFLEEDKQESASADKLVKPEDKAKERDVKRSSAEESDRGLTGKAKELVEKVTGQKPI